MKKLLAAGTALAILSPASASANPTGSDNIVITRNGSQPSIKGPDQ